MTLEMLLALGCGLSTSNTQSVGPPAKTSTYVYVAQASQPSHTAPEFGELSQLKANADGTLVLLTPATFQIDIVPIFLTVAPSGQFLLASGSGINGTSIEEFTIAADGTLNQTPAQKVLTDGFLYATAFTPNAKYVLAIDFGLNQLNSYSVGANGLLTLVATVPTGNFPEFLAIEPSGKFAYVTSTNDNLITGYTISTSGQLAAIGSVSSGGIRTEGLAISPQGLLYSSQYYPGKILEFAINHANGQLTLRNSFSIGSDYTWKITFAPSGQYAYVSLAGEVAQMRVNPSGRFLTNGPLLTNLAPIALDPAGHFGFALSDSDTVSGFTVMSTGTLSSQGSVVLDPNAQAQYVVAGNR